MRQKATSWAILATTLLLLALANETTADSYFRQRVAPILERRCLACHNDTARKGDFSLQTASSALAHGFIEAHNAAESHLLDMISPVGGKAKMPKNASPLPEAEIAILRKWINDGAKWPGEMSLQEPRLNDFTWWSYRPIKRPTVPRFNDSWVKTPIDAFVLDKLNQLGLEHSCEADRRTLIRRASYDLIGLPPTPEKVEAFVADPDPQVYERLVDRLLASPQYGERWARHWLDVVKYADTCGYDKDRLRPNAWPYRDYVIRSFNEDKPYARFVQEQIAGDALFPGEPDGILGLGFIAAGPWDFIGHVEVPESKIDGMVARNLDRDDMVSNSINTFCSVTVQCARCHDHKFDPITQEHYYGLQAIFAAVDRAERPYDLDLQIERQRREIQSQLQKLRANAQQPEDSSRTGESKQFEHRDSTHEAIKDLEEKLAALPAGRMVYAAATHFTRQANFKPTEGSPRAIHMLHRGDIQKPGNPAVPGVLPLDGQSDSHFAGDLTESERRAALAEWVTDRNHPLVWRSIVNRVWQYHFGQGIVATPNDFGRMGAEPTHPELLDWLAAEFRDGGQSLKSLHRLIMTSSVYRQSSRYDRDNAAIDASNQYLWRRSRRRLEAEEIRDSILAVSGALDATMGGPGFYLFKLDKTEHSPHYEYHLFDPADPASHRRSIYRFIVRSQPNPFMSTLDCADSSQSTPTRSETVTSLQALALLNNRFTLLMAQQFAERLKGETRDSGEQIDRAMKLVTQRLPNRSERDDMMDYARSHGLPNLCRYVFNLSEFVYVD